MTDGRPAGDDGHTVSHDLDDRAALAGADASAASSSVWPASASASGWRRARPRHVPSHRRAFRRFYREHFGLVWSMVRRFGVPSAQHEDAVQEVWLAAYRRLHTLEPDASAKAWLSTITRRVASRLRRTEHRKARKLAALHVASERGPARADVVDGRDARRLLEALLAVLDEEQRDVLVLASVHGLSGPEIAEVLEIPLNTAYSRLRLARRRIDRFVAEAGTEQALVIGALRRSEEPPPRAAMRVWVALVPQLGLPGVGAAASSGALGGIASVKAFAVAVAVGMVGLVTARVVVDARVDAKPERAAQVGGATGGRGPARGDREVEPSHAEADADGGLLPAAVAGAVEPAARGGLDASSATRAVSASARARSSAVDASASKSAAPSRGAAASVPVASTGAPASTLTAEAELLARAQQALREGDAAAALRLLEEHERRFPAGELGDARRGARVRALCDLGRGAQARAEASSLLRERPHSPVAAGVADVCSRSG